MTTCLTRTLLAALLAAGVACSNQPASAKGRPAVTYSVIERSPSLDDIERLVWRPGIQARYAASTAAEREAIARLVPQLLAGARAAAPPELEPLEADAYQAGFRIERWRVDGQTYWALVELPERRRGAGAYVFRVGAAADADEPEILLEAPHHYHDVGTGTLAAQLFFFPPPGRRPRGFFTNTIHRYQSAPGKRVKQKLSPADVAHNPEHVFATATEAFATALGGRVLVLQLHGFGNRVDEDDEAEPAPDLAMVVSAGDARGSSPRSQALAAALARGFGAGVKRFPEDVAILGATTNVQARLLQRIRGAEFVHLELSAELRERLKGDAALRAQLATILFNTAAEPGR